MNDEQREQWEADRIQAIRTRLRELHETHPDRFWDELDRAVAMLVINCADIGATDWPENLHLADVIDKHLARNVE